MTFFRSDVWKKLLRKGLQRAHVFFGQHSQARPRIMRVRWDFLAPRDHPRMKEKAKRRRQIARGQLRIENGLEPGL